MSIKMISRREDKTVHLRPPGGNVATVFFHFGKWVTSSSSHFACEVGREEWVGPDSSLVVDESLE